MEMSNMFINQWIMTGRVGTSSKTLWVAMMDIDMGEGTFGDIPHDPDDFSRCIDLMSLATIEQRALALKNVVKLNPVWIPFAREWKKLEKLYYEELPDGNCPKLYDLLEDLRMEGYAIKKALRDKKVKCSQCQKGSDDEVRSNIKNDTDI